MFYMLDTFEERTLIEKHDSFQRTNKRNLLEFDYFDYFQLDSAKMETRR